MGNSASSNGRGQPDDTVDFGRLTPQGVYTGPKDWNHAIVTQLICERKLAPFYRPLEDYADDWDDEQILAARKDLPEPEPGHSESSIASRHESSHSISSRQTHGKRPAVTKEGIQCPDAAIYRGAVECPICFLYYPPNINHSRCCDQAICTECFVQIKRAEPTTTHIVSEPASCPYCVQDKFGVVYTPPPWRAGIGSDGTMSPHWSESPKGSPNATDSSQRPTHKRRQKSFGHDSPEVVTTDQIRPDWEAKLAAVRAAVTRRANRRIIMRQVGDRLIPVGVTSGRVHTISAEEAAQAENGGDTGGSRRSRRSRNQNQDLNQFLGSMGLGGQDLEELMIMEAMRLSLVEHEEQQRREAANQNSSDSTAAAPGAASASGAIGSEPASHSHTPTTSESPAHSVPLLTPAPPSPITIPTLNIERSQSRNRSPTPSTPSRNRTPSPTIPDSLRLSNDSSGSWRRRSSSPRPFSTIAAAMSAATTATAILGNDSSHTAAPTSTSSSPVLASSFTAASSLPAAIDTPSAPHSSDELTGKPIRPTMSIPTESYASSIFSTDSTQVATSSYDVLGSSPDSEFSREPLLGSGPATPTLPEAGQNLSAAGSSQDRE